MLLFPAIAPAVCGLAPWFPSALASPLTLICLTLSFFSLLTLLFSLIALYRLGKQHGAAVRKSRLLLDADGTAMIEFTLVLPVVLFMSLLLTQSTLVMAGNLYIHYAAYAATRSAITQIPVDATNAGEAPNVLIPGRGHTKHEAVRRAAVLALLPVSGRQSSGGGNSTDPIIPGIDQFYRAYNQTTPAWVTNGMLADKLRYADTHTDITFYSYSPDQPQLLSDNTPYTFGPKDPVTVQVTHQLDLAVPYVRTLFADGHTSANFDRGPRFTKEAEGAIHYTTLTAQYTLTNEGIDTTLPPAPPLPRQP